MQMLNSVKALIYNPIHGTLTSFYSQLVANKEVLRNLLKNSVWLAVAQGLNGIANFFIVVYMARVFGPIEYGKFVYAFSLVMLFSILFDFGLTMAVTREFARDPLQEKYFQSLFFLKFLIGIFAVVLVFGVSCFITHDLAGRQMIMMLGLYQLFFQSLNLFYAVFRARQRMEFEAIIRLIQIVSLIACIVFMSYFKHSVLAVSVAYAFSSFSVLLITLIFFSVLSSQALLQFKFKINFVVCKQFLLVGLYLALSQGVGDIMINTDSFLLGYWGMLEGAGLYYAVSKINAMVLFLMSIISAALFPILVKALVVSQQEFLRLWATWMRHTVFFAVMIAFLIIACSQDIIKILYTAKYMQASITLKILMVMAIIAYINNLYFQALLIFNQQKILLYAIVCGSVLNVILNIFLIPKLGIEGSAIATVMGQFANGLYLFIASKKTCINSLHKNFLSTLSLAIIAGIVMWLAVSISQLPLFISALGGALLYSTAYFLLKNGVWQVMRRGISYASR